LRCPSCRVVFVHPKPDRETLSAWYARKIQARSPEDYWAGYLAREASFRSHGRYVLGMVGGLARPPGRLLEVGCGPGFFLDEARTAGWEVAGVDLAAPFIAWGRERLGLDLRHGELEDQRYPASSFDVAVMLDVLSHLADPRGSLNQIHRILAGRGVLFLQAGAKAEARVKRAGDDWETPLHLFHYTRETLRLLLANAGFEIARMITAPRVIVPAAARILRRVPLAPRLYRALRRAAGVLRASRPAPGSTVYVAARKR
jgi:SAM-dependent methyltransferase